MIGQPAPNADYLDRPGVREKLRARPVATYLGARRGVIGYAVLVGVAVAGAVDAWRFTSPWLGVALALVVAHAVLDWIVSWYRVASLAYHRAIEQAHRDPPVSEEARVDPPVDDADPGEVG
jgi:hypothetical protein